MPIQKAAQGVLLTYQVGLILGSVPTTPMNFWTPERCKTISTLILMDNSAEISMQAALSKNPEIAARKTAIVEMIQAELRSRV